MISSASSVARALLEDGAPDDFDSEELVRAASPTAFSKEEVVKFFNDNLQPWKFHLAHDSRDLGHDDRDVYLQVDVQAPPETSQSALRTRLRRGAERFATAHDLFVVEVYVNLSDAPGRGMVSFRVAPKLYAPPKYRDWWSIAKKRRLWKEQEWQRKFGSRQESLDDDGSIADEIQWPNEHGDLLPKLRAVVPGVYEIEHVNWYEGKGIVNVSARVITHASGGRRLRQKMTRQNVGDIARTIRQHLMDRGFVNVRVHLPDDMRLRTSEILPVTFSAFYAEPSNPLPVPEPPAA